MKKLIAANWKMNLKRNEAEDLVSKIEGILAQQPELQVKSDLLICPSYVYLPMLAPLCKKAGIALGAQDCSMYEQGAYTGEVSSSMLKELGCSYVVLGHSERRQYHKEEDSLVCKKAMTAHKHGLITIICVGESQEERESGRHKEIVKTQLLNSISKDTQAQNTVIAYEPVWAIGTGKTASSDDVREMHDFIRSTLKENNIEGADDMRLLYGGSMKPSNAEVLLALDNVNGGLIGGAALNAQDFTGIAKAG